MTSRLEPVPALVHFAESLDSPTPLLAASAEIYREGMKQGREKQDTASVCAVLEEMAGFKGPN